MKITLRKASAIQQSIQEAIKALDVNTSLTFNEFDDVNAKLEQALENFYENAARFDSLTRILLAIRKAVGEANQPEIGNLLAEIASIEKTIQFFTNINNSASDALEPDVIKGKLEKIKNAGPDTSRSIYPRSDEVTTGILNKKILESHKQQIAKLKKKKIKLQDRVLELNIKTEIELSGDIEDLIELIDLV